MAPITIASGWPIEARRSVAIGGALVGAVGCIALLAPWLGDPYYQDFAAGLSPLGLPLGPSPAHPLGTDTLGRDVLARAAFAGRVSLSIGILAAVLSLALGAAVGMVAGFYGGFLEAFLMRLTDIGLALPTTLAGLALTALLPAGPLRPVAIITILFWAYPARLIYNETLRMRRRGFVEAAVAMGEARHRILLRHVLPHLKTLLLTYAPMNAAAAVMMEATLSYLGAGVPLPTPSWGNMIGEGQGALAFAPHLFLAPAAFLLLTTMGLLLIAEGLKQAHPGERRFSWLAL